MALGFTSASTFEVEMKFFEQLRHGTRGDDLPPVDHADHIAVLLGFPHVVGGHNNGEALTPVPVQNIPELPPQMGIEIARGFIEDQKRGVAHQGNGDEEPAFFASRQVFVGCFLLALQIEVVHQHSGIDRVLIHARIETQRLFDPNIVVQRIFLKLDADSTAYIVAPLQVGDTFAK